MRIAFVVGSFPALSLTFIQNQVTGLIDLGHEVDIFAERPRAEDSVHEAFQQYSLSKNTFYWQPPQSYFERLRSAYQNLANSPFYQKLRLIQALNFLAYGKSAFSLRCFYQVMTFITHQKYDVIHGHFGPFGNLGLLMKELGAIEGKLVTSFHGFDLSQELAKNTGNPYRKLFHKGDLFLPISSSWKDKLSSMGCDPKKIKVHKMGIDLNEFRFCERKILKSPNIKILSVARLTEKKGLKYAILAIAKLLKEYPNIEYKIVGDGPLEILLSQLIKENNLTDNIQLLGSKSQQSVSKLMQDSDILLAPSITGQSGDKEGIPVVLMEALAVGLPIISTYHSGIPELIEDGKTGFLVQEKDILGLIKKIRYLLNNTQDIEAVRIAGRSFIEKNHDIKNLTIELAEKYKLLLE